MKITSILVLPDKINFSFDCARETVSVMEYEPLANVECALLSEHEVVVNGTSAVIPRFLGKHDRLYSRFEVYAENIRIPGPQYVTDFDPSVPENKNDYPILPTKKTLHGTEEDILALGIRQQPVNINLPNLMTTVKTDDTIDFEHDGKTYYFIREAVEKVDAVMRRSKKLGLTVTMILLNSPRLFGSTGEKALLDKCLHPGFDFECPDAFISAFNMHTHEGQGYYRAFVEFLCERYTKPDSDMGCVAGAIISNEVDSQYVWGNAGEMDVKDYVSEYNEAMRQAWFAGQKHSKSFRVYVSLDQYWHKTAHNVRFPKRYYSGRDIIDELVRLQSERGEFPWCVAYHPYPEDLRWPDFWHDRAPDFTFSTPKITFKNMEVLQAYLSQPHALYRNTPRRIIFSEQGFNSHSGALQSLTEKMAEAGYVLAYLKAKNMPTVDMFMHHAYVDNPHEFGLNLGIRRFDPAAPHHAGEKKPIWYAVYDMDTEREAARIEKARAFIGEELFDYLLNPPIEMGDRDTSKDNEFG
ncbi:MAG: hypothetical protein II266_04325 [Clostridia bacterium]|nr:hypothetical protein [Clostridia bacterium]